MFIKLVLDAGKSFSSVDELVFTSPKSVASPDKQEILLFNRLPVGVCEGDFRKAISDNCFDFVWSTEEDFVVFHIKLDNKRPIIKTVTDRYGSWRVYHKLDSSRYVVTTDWQQVTSKDFSFSAEGLSDLISSRLLFDNHFVFDGVKVNPLNHVSCYDGALSFHEIRFPATKLPQLHGDSAAIDFIESRLKDSLRIVSTEHRSCAVLLSGGTDSFILAALAKQIFGKVIAYTPTWEDDFNPELERAQEFAAHLELEHRIVTLPVNEIGDAYSQLIQAMGIPIRNFSSVPLFALLRYIEEEAVLYGEFADTLFGSKPFKGRLLDRKYHRLLSPLRFVPKIGRVLNSLSISQNLYSITWLHGISDPDFKRAAAIYFGDEGALTPPFMRSDDTMESWKNMNLLTSCRQHMVEIELAAAFYNKVVVTPFYSRELVQLSGELTDEQLFGRRGLSILRNFKQDYSLEVKKLLKELACRHIDGRHIYRSKLGFPTPHVKWILELFKEDLNQLKVQGIIDSTDPAYIKRSYEWVWTQLNLYHISQIVKQTASEARLAPA